MTQSERNDILSPCCEAAIFAARGDGVWIGTCAKCGVSVVRINPRTGTEEWLDGSSPWAVIGRPT